MWLPCPSVQICQCVNKRKKLAPSTQKETSKEKRKNTDFGMSIESVILLAGLDIYSGMFILLPLFFMEVGHRKEPGLLIKKKRYNV